MSFENAAFGHAQTCWLVEEAFVNKIVHVIDFMDLIYNLAQNFFASLRFYLNRFPEVFFTSVYVCSAHSLRILSYCQTWQLKRSH